MNRKEIMEIKKRMTGRSASFSRMAGCYVDMNREKVCCFGDQFLTLPEDEFHKYLEIAAHVLSGAHGDHLLDLEFPREEEQEGGRQELLMRLRASELKDEALLSQWYDHVIASYRHTGNYLILLFFDSYDIPLKTMDDLLLDDSEEVYKYLLCAVCPVELSQSGLGYRSEENCFGACERDWIVGMPETGFLFPSFNSRSADIHETLFYTKNTKEPHGEMMEAVLGCRMKNTATEEKLAFSEALRGALGDEEGAEDRFLTIQKNLKDRQLLQENENGSGESEEKDPMVLDAALLKEVLGESEIPEVSACRISSAVRKAFGEDTPQVAHVIDKYALRTGEIRLEKNAAVRELAASQAEAGRLREEIASLKAAEDEENYAFAVTVKVDEEKADRIRTDYVDGERYLLIPLERGEAVSINGEEAEV